MKIVAEAELSEEYVANIVRNALRALSHLGAPASDPPQLAYYPGGPPAFQSGRELLITWKWNHETQQPSAHIRVVELPPPDPAAMRKAEDNRQVDMLTRVAKTFRGD